MGERGVPVEAFPLDPEVVTLTGGVFACDEPPDPGLLLAPLNGGIGAMNIEIFFGALLDSAVGLLGPAAPGPALVAAAVGF